MPYLFRCSYNFVLNLKKKIYSLFSAGGSPNLIKNIEVQFEIKPQHRISRGNMYVDQPFIIQCSRRSAYFSEKKNILHVFITVSLLLSLSLYIYIYIYVCVCVCACVCVCVCVSVCTGSYLGVSI